MNTKSVQVVMSTYNGEKYLKEQIDRRKKTRSRIRVHC